MCSSNNCIYNAIKTILQLWQATLIFQTFTKESSPSPQIGLVIPSRFLAGKGENQVIKTKGSKII